MAETHLQVNLDGSISDEKTNLLPSNRDLRERLLSKLLSIDNWKVKSIDNPNTCLWKVVVSNSNVELKLNLFVSSVRDEARRPDEFKSQFGGKVDPNIIEEGWINIPLGIYIRNENDDVDKWLLVAFEKKGINFSTNPSLRGVRTKLLQEAQRFGLVRTPFSTLFRPEFIYYVINLFLQGNGDRDNLLENEWENFEVASPLDLPLQLIYYGAPGTGKSFTIDDLTDDRNSVRTTFHPDSDYASFVGAYKPTMAEIEMSYVSEGKAKFAQPFNGHPGTEKKIVYKYVPQAFLKAYVAAWSNLDTPYYLIIEEINRGNCAQIFGDLFQLLDRNNSGSSTYAIHADEDIAQFLSGDSKGFASLSDEQKDAIRSFVLCKDNGKTRNVGQDILDGKLLLLPPNLYIWATMNTSDQSLFPIDSAFKRRWNWKYMPIEYHPNDRRTGEPIDWKFQIGDNLYSWGEFLETINPQIYALTESSDKKMGYFFAKADPKTGIIPEDVFLNKVLFYLWTDVFKDFDVSSEIFKNKNADRSFIFTDFFDDPEALGNFIANLKLNIMEVDMESIKDEDMVDGDGKAPGDNSVQRDYSHYSIDGKGDYNKRQTVLRSLRKYIENNPALSAAEVIDRWRGVNPQIPLFILSASDYESRVAQYPNQRDRFWSVTTGTGEKVYITNQWNSFRINEFKDLMNRSDLGIHIEKIGE